MKTEEAKTNLLRAALRCLSTGLAGEHANADAEAEYADEMLAVAARDLCAATEALPACKRPLGWVIPDDSHPVHEALNRAPDAAVVPLGRGLPQTRPGGTA